MLPESNKSDAHVCSGKVLECSLISILKMIIVKRSLQLHLIVVTTGTMAMALAELELTCPHIRGGSRGSVSYPP